MLKRYFWLAHVLLVTLAALWTADIAKSYIRATLASPVTPKQITRQDSPLRSPRKSPSDYNVITERNVFNATPPGTEQPTTPPPPPVEQPLEATQLQLQLVGTVAGANGYAIIADLSTRGLQGVYQIGDAIQNAYIVEIRPNCVVLDKNGNHESLCFEQDGTKQEESQRRAAPPPPPRQAASNDDITRVDEGTWRVSRELISDNFSNLGSLSRQARVMPYTVQGEMRGFRLAQLRPGSLFRRIGLQIGDVIQKVNGLEITSPEEALQAFQQLQSASTIRLELLRQNQATTLTYELQ